MRLIKSLLTIIYTYLGSTCLFNNFRGKTTREPGFSVAEAMITLLIISVILASAASLISKQMQSNAFNSLQVNKLLSEIEALKGNNSPIPAGVITMWSGATNNIPKVWALCDGSNGTPDLRDRFVVGAGSSYTSGATGGENNIVLTIEQIPPHTHGIYLTRGDAYWYNGSGNTWWGSSFNTLLTSTSAGGGQAHENRPPYYALAYIMKIAET